MGQKLAGSSSSFFVSFVLQVKLLYHGECHQRILHLLQNQKFIIRVLDNTHLFVQPHAAEMIRSAMSEFREANTYKKPP